MYKREAKLNWYGVEGEIERGCLTLDRLVEEMREASVFGEDLRSVRATLNEFSNWAGTVLQMCMWSIF